MDAKQAMHVGTVLLLLRHSLAAAQRDQDRPDFCSLLLGKFPRTHGTNPLTIRAFPKRDELCPIRKTQAGRVEMAASRREKKAVEKPAEAVRFMPLDGSGWEDSGYLPPEGDHSWREMEPCASAPMTRIGHLPPKSNQSWREQEALRFAAMREAVPTVSADDSPDDTGNAEGAGDPIAELAAPEPVADPMLDLMSDRIAEPVDSRTPKPMCRCVSQSPNSNPPGVARAASCCCWWRWSD